MILNMKKITKKIINKFLGYFNLKLIKNSESKNQDFPIEANQDIKKFIKLSTQFSMTGKKRMYALFQAIENSRNNNLVVSIEEHNVIGGLGSAIAEHLSKLSNRPKQLFLGIKDVYGKGGEYNFLLDKHGLTPNKIVNEILLNYKK